jgi:hypothetical protein
VSSEHCSDCRTARIRGVKLANMTKRYWREGREGRDRGRGEGRGRDKGRGRGRGKGRGRGSDTDRVNQGRTRGILEVQSIVRGL